MSMNVNCGKKMSFWQMLEGNDIKIPSIQRDYAQGRNDAVTNKIRENFLKALYNALIGNDLDNENELKLDFVYGSMRDGIMQPLDGQQRLTTLWLLHWFIAKKAGASSEQLEILKKFSYDVRTSSERFCEKLVDYIYPANDQVQNLSDCIKNEAWFFSSWISDPTIQSMLNMLDDIRNIFKNTEINKFSEYWTSLVEHSPIVFYYLSLEKLSLPEELYIKMNARGKQLTVFENLKAKLISKSEKNEWEKDKDYKKRIDYKFDVDWANIFWKYRNKTDENKPLIDDNLLNLLMVSKMIEYGENDVIYENEDEFRSMLQKIRDNNSHYRKKISESDETVRSERINERIQRIHGNPQELDVNDFETLRSVNRFFELYEDEKFRNYRPGINLFEHSVGRTLFETAIGYNSKILSFRETALFYAQSIYFEYLKDGKISDAQFDNWMRVMRNIVSAAWIEDSTSFRGSVKYIKKMAEICLNGNNIYLNLCNLNLDDIGFAKEETLFERLKAKIMAKADFDCDVVKSLYALEDSFYFKANNNFKGNLKFVLRDCMGVSEENLEGYTVERAKIIEDFVSDNFANSDFSDKFRAAMLLYDPNCYGKSFSVSYKLGGLPKYRFFSSLESFKKDFESSGSAFEALLKDVLSSTNHKVDDILLNAKQMSGWNLLQNWKKKIVEDPSILTEHCSSHLFSAPEDGAYCLLFEDKKRPEHVEDCYRID